MSYSLLDSVSAASGPGLAVTLCSGPMLCSGGKGCAMPGCATPGSKPWEVKMDWRDAKILGEVPINHQFPNLKVSSRWGN